MREPNFIGIGAPKAATSWLFQCLSEHPGICAAKDKELDFFVEPNFFRGRKWYEAHFSTCKNDQLVGEFTPTYLHRKNTAERIHKLYPHTKFIVVLRNPIERFLSEFFFQYGLGRHNYKTPEELPQEKYQKMLERGLYGKHLEHWLQIFPKEQFLVLLYEDIQQNPLAFVQSVFAFLKVDKSFIPPSIGKRENVTGNNRARSRTLKRTYYRVFEYISNQKYSETIFSMLNTLGIGAFVKFIMHLNNRPMEKVVPTEKKADIMMREKLKEAYKTDIEKLEALIGKNLIRKWGESYEQ